MTNQGKGFRGVEGKIGYLLRQASHAIRLKINRRLEAEGITHPQFAVLSVLEFEPGLHAADIARVCMLSPQAVNIIINNLTKAGLILKKPHDIHGRVLEIFLTKLGKEKLKYCKNRVNIIENEMLLNLKPMEEKLIRTWLVRCANES